MPGLPDTPFLRLVFQGLGVGAILATMALMAFVAAVALLGATIIAPIAIGLIMARQRLAAAWRLTGARRIVSQG
ncbi:hypothetical protein [Microvirga yunnanensis]|uniref:hypothetical protein n=1 Tax=Microvirga yunnanensis TaxID=2953740 RepID=UPI0021C63110|nr:hypothetical protein [Microvirga sp. HBU65207]